MENWITENRLNLINRPDDPDTFYSQTRRTTSTPDLAIAIDDIQRIAERQVSSQLGGSDHRPVIISMKGVILLLLRSPAISLRFIILGVFLRM